MSEEWGPWIEHDGKGCPCVGQYVHVIYADDVCVLGIAMDGGSWTYGQVYEYDTWLDGCVPIIRYRIRKPSP